MFITEDVRRGPASTDHVIDPVHKRAFLRLLAGQPRDRLALEGTRELAQSLEAPSGGFRRREWLVLTTLGIYAVVAGIVAPWPWNNSGLTGEEYSPLLILVLTGALCFPLLCVAVQSVPRETRRLLHPKVPSIQRGAGK